MNAIGADMRHVGLDAMRRERDRAAAGRRSGSTTLLSRRDVRALFPGVRIEIERLLGLGTSIMAHDL